MKTLAPLVALVLSCAASQPGVTPSTAREITHSIAVGYCSVHHAAEPLILAATATWPPMVIPARVADAFCAAVAINDVALHREALALPAGTLPVMPAYSLSTDGFSVR